MVEIGAGGGSIARVNKLEQIITGPDSAGLFLVLHVIIMVVKARQSQMLI